MSSTALSSSTFPTCPLPGRPIRTPAGRSSASSAGSSRARARSTSCWPRRRSAPPCPACGSSSSATTPTTATPQYADQVRRAEGVEHVRLGPGRRRGDAPSRRARRPVATGAVRHRAGRGDGRRHAGRRDPRRWARRGRRRRRHGPARDAGEPDALAAAVLEVLAARDTMGAAAREHAQRFGADAYADRVEAILLEAVAAAGTGRPGLRTPPAARPTSARRLRQPPAAGPARHRALHELPARRAARDPRPKATRSSRRPGRGAVTSTTRRGSTARCCARPARRS